MSTLQDRVQDYCGTISDTAQLTDVLTAGAKVIVNAIPEEKLDLYSAAITDSGSGATVSGHRLVRAHKSGYTARQVDAGLKAQVVLATSMHKATTTSPVWYIENGSGYVIPSGGTIIGVSYPTVLYSDSTISNFPTEWIQGVVLYAVVQVLLGKSNAIYDTLNALTMDTITAPTVPNAASFTFTDASYSNASFTSASYVDASYGVVTYTPATIDVTAATTLGVIPTPPTYTKPTTTFSVTNATTYIGTDEDLEKAQTELAKQSSLLEQFGKDQYNELNEFNAEIQNQQIAVNHLIEQARLDQQRLIDQSQKVVQLNEFNAQKVLETALTNASKAMEVDIVNKDKTAQIDLQNKIQAMQLDIQNKAKAAEIDVLNKTKSLEKQIQEYQSNLQRYSEQLNGYAQDINKASVKFNGVIQKSLGLLNSNNTLIEQCRNEFKTILSLI